MRLPQLWNVAMCILGLLGRAPGDRAVTVRITGVLNFPTGSSSPDLRPWEKRLPPPVPRPHVSQLASLSLSGLQAAAHWLLKMRLVRGSAHGEPFPFQALERKSAAIRRGDFQFIWSPLKASNLHTYFFFLKSDAQKTKHILLYNPIYTQSKIFMSPIITLPHAMHSAIFPF